MKEENEYKSTSDIENSIKNKTDLFWKEVDRNKESCHDQRKNKNEVILPDSRNEANSALNPDEPLLTVSIDIDENRHEILNIYPNEDINEVTDKFCKKHNLAEDQKNYLIQHIKKSLFQIFERVDKKINGEDELQKDLIQKKYETNIPTEIKEEKEQ